MKKCLGEEVSRCLRGEGEEVSRCLRGGTITKREGLLMKAMLWVSGFLAKGWGRARRGPSSERSKVFRIEN